MALSAVEEAQLRDLIAQQAALLSLAGVEPTILSKLGATKVTLSGLPTASAINDADLLLARQGTTDKSVTASILAQYLAAELGSEFVNVTGDTMAGALALFGGDTGVTPAQFDDDTSLATTAFVQRALGNYSTVIPSNGTLALTQLYCGRMIVGNAAGTITLPSGGETVSGAAILVHSIVSGVVVSRNGSDNIYPGGETLTSIPMNAGDWCLFIWFLGYGWVAYGTPTLRYSSQSILGPGQTVQNVTVSRALNVTYTNTTNKPIVVRVRATAGSAGAAIGLICSAVQDSTSIAQAAGQNVGVNGVVHPGETYSISSSGSVTLASWIEVR